MTGPAKTPAAPKVAAPKTPEPVEIIELVDVTRWGFVVFALIAGLAVGVAVYYLATHIEIGDDNA